MTDRSSYICDPGACHLSDGKSLWGSRSGHCWHESLWRKLSWLYGEERANIIAMGRDPATNADIAAWNGMGR